jgi:hypothetical protein
MDFNELEFIIGPVPEEERETTRRGPVFYDDNGEYIGHAGMVHLWIRPEEWQAVLDRRAQMAGGRDLITLEDMSILVGVAVKTLYNWRNLEGGKPEPIDKVGRHDRFSYYALYRLVAQRDPKRLQSVPPFYDDAMMVLHEVSSREL